MPTTNNRPLKQDFEDLILPHNDRSQELASDLQQAQERLINLKRQMEEAERRERELEELKRRRDEIANGQKQMIEKLARAISLLEGAEYETRRETEQLQMIRESFNEHFIQLQGIHPTEWTPETIEENINRAMSQIDNARAVYSQSRARIDALSGQDIEGDSSSQAGFTASFASHAPMTENHSFIEWMRRGIAFTLPLVLVLAVLIYVLIQKVNPLLP